MVSVAGLSATPTGSAVPSGIVATTVFVRPLITDSRPDWVVDEGYESLSSGMGLRPPGGSPSCSVKQQRNLRRSRCASLPLSHAMLWPDRG
jgi:hypothetical protein